MADTKRAPKTRTTRRPAKERRDWKTPWLEAFRAEGTVSAACAAVNVSRSTVYDARVDEEFAAAWDAIEKETTDAMEREAYRRAVEGTSEPLVSAGRLVTNVQKYSDTLLIFMLKARRPDVYRENVKIEHAGRIDGKHEIHVPDTAERRQTVVELLAGAGLANGSRN
jgi:hypothetical protein